MCHPCIEFDQFEINEYTPNQHVKRSLQLSHGLNFIFVATQQIDHILQLCLKLFGINTIQVQSPISVKVGGCVRAGYPQRARPAMSITQPQNVANGFDPFRGGIVSLPLCLSCQLTKDLAALAAIDRLAAAQRLIVAHRLIFPSRPGRELPASSLLGLPRRDGIGGFFSCCPALRRNLPRFIAAFSQPFDGAGNCDWAGLLMLQLSG
jgi:hypothetical protein